MKFFKKPAVAAVIAFFLVVFSTYISICADIEPERDEVNALFYSGESYGGEEHAPISEQLRSTAKLAKEMCIIAENYDIDTQPVADSCEDLELALTYSPNEFGYIHSVYTLFSSELKSMTDKLAMESLSDRHRSLFEDYEQQLKTAEYNIDNSGFNNEVRAFIQQYNYFPAKALIECAGIKMPEYFA